VRPAELLRKNWASVSRQAFAELGAMSSHASWRIDISAARATLASGAASRAHWKTWGNTTFSRFATREVPSPHALRKDRSRGGIATRRRPSDNLVTNAPVLLTTDADRRTFARFAIREVYSVRQVAFLQRQGG
jgi:hypothetical protein